MTTDNFCFYFQNRLIQTSQAGGQWYSDTSPFSIPCLLNLYENKVTECCNILSASLCFISISDLKMKRARHEPVFRVARPGFTHTSGQLYGLSRKE
jgi:hypothetical protein